MPIDPNIALQVQPLPAANPLDALAKVLQIKNAIAQQPMIAAEVQRAGLENQQLGQQIGATQALNDSFKNAVTVGADGTPTLDKEAVTKDLAARGYGSQIPTVLEHFNTMEKAAGEVKKQKADLAESEQNYVGSLGAAARAANYDPTVLAMGLQHGVALGYQTAGQALQMLQQDPSKAQAIADHLIASSPKQTQLQNEAAMAATGAKQATTAATRLNLETPKLQAEGVLEQAKANLTKLTPDQWAAQVDAVAPPAANPSYNAMIKSRIAFAAKSGDVEGAKKILDEAAEYTAAPGKAAAVESATAPIRAAAEIAKETNPRVLAARTQQAVDTAKALRAGDNPALAGVPPAAVAPATSAATKLDMDYAKAKASADSIETVLNMAGAGNKAAGANASLVGVGAVNAVNGIKRINSAEIAQYGTAGSLLDKIQGKLQGWTEGQPIPKDVLDDMRALHQALRSSSYQQYTDGLNSINQRYGSKFGPTAPAPATPKNAPGTAAPPAGAKVQRNSATGQIRWSTDGGKTWQMQ
jgi:hypothetical protein